MPELLTCPQGHQWEGLNPSLAPEQNRLCPACGGEAAVAGQDGTSAAASRPVVAGYEILRELGRGGLGTVYLARHPKTGQRVALKLVTPDPAAGAKAIQEFLFELSDLSEFHHRRVVSLYALGLEHRRFFFASEFVETVDLQALLAPLSLRRFTRVVCGIVYQALGALRDAHEKGLVHGDIKPSNLLVSRAGDKIRAKLADFGLLRGLRTHRLLGHGSDHNLRGSLPFMAPEQFLDARRAQPAADVYGAGATLYALLSNCPPYDFPLGEDAQAIILEKTPIPLRRRSPSFPKELAAVVHQALAKRAEERFASAQAMRHALLPFVKERKR